MINFIYYRQDQLPHLPQKCPDMPDIIFGQHGIDTLLHNVNLSKARGPDQILVRYQKETATETAPIFIHLFKESYEKS